MRDRQSDVDVVNTGAKFRAHEALQSREEMDGEGWDGVGSCSVKSCHVMSCDVLTCKCSLGQ